jgi:hypothetical protein
VHRCCELDEVSEDSESRSPKKVMKVTDTHLIQPISGWSRVRFQRRILATARLRLKMIA